MGGDIGKFLGEITNPLKGYSAALVGMSLGGLPAAVIVQLAKEQIEENRERKEQVKRLKRELSALRQENLEFARETEEYYKAKILANGKEELARGGLENLKVYFNEMIECINDPEMDPDECLYTYEDRVVEEYRSIRVR